MMISAGNQLDAVISEIVYGPVAMITNEAVGELRLREGDEVVAVIKAGDVMVAN